MYLNLVLSLTLILIYSVESEYVKITNDGPIVYGGTILFRAQVYNDDGTKLTGSYDFEWRDNALPEHKDSFFTTTGISAWNVTYGKDSGPGLYEVQVHVKKKYGFITFTVASARQWFNVTMYLNGRLDFEQSDTILGGDNINFKTEVIHRVNLNSADAKLLMPNQTVVKTFWFIDCLYMGSSSDLSFSFNYTKDDIDKPIEVQVWLELGPQNNTTVLNSTNEIDNTTSTVSSTLLPTSTQLPTTTPVFKGCGDDSIVPQDPDKYYGKFTRKIIPTSPVTIGNVQGSTWLQNGELLQLNLTCSGSAPFYNCIRFIKGEYNTTGNETCNVARQLQSCRIAVTRLLQAGSHYTLLFIIGNKVSNVVKPVGVTMYSEPTIPQLSVIIVPITCCSIAVVLIIFGVAYYIQSKNRYTIEVADFDFTRRDDTEYKTFKQRLRDAVSSAFTRVHEEYSEEGPIGNVWSPTRKNTRQGLLFDSDSETVDS